MTRPPGELLGSSRSAPLCSLSDVLQSSRSALDNSARPLRMSTMLSDKPGKLSHFTHHLQAPPGWTWDPGALVQPSIRPRRATQARNVKALDLCNPGACQRCAVKMMNGHHISKALADLGSYWQAHHSQHVSQLITSNFIFLVNTS